VLATFRKLQAPAVDEGFDAIYQLTISPDLSLTVTTA
jgi:hypothetical protein